MYINRSKNTKTWRKGDKGQIFFSPQTESNNENNHRKREELKLSNKASSIKPVIKKALLQWEAPEFEILQRDKKWYVLMMTILLIIISYALYTNSLVMAITFILIGVVGYIYINKEPRILNFAITEEGILVGRELYAFDNLKSFWIFYEPYGVKVISLHTDSYLAPYVHIPIHNQDPVEIRKILLEYILEEKQEPGLTETLDRLIKL